MLHSVNFNLIDHYVDVYNYDEPLVKYFYNLSNGIFPDSYTTNHLNFNPVIVKTHEGFIFNRKIEEFSYSFTQNEKVTTTWDSNNKGIYVAFYFWMQNKMEYYERTFKRVQDVFADIGGMYNAILLIATSFNKLVSKYITILDTEKILIKTDHKTARNIYNTGKIYKDDFRKTQLYFNKKEEDEKRSKKNKNDSENINNIKSENNTIKNDRYNKSSDTKNIMSNNYFMNNKSSNNFVKVLNKDNKICNRNSISIEKRKEYQSIKSISFSFLDYLLLIICKKRKKILNYEKFRLKVLSEEHIIQNYLCMCKLLNMPGSQNEAIKMFEKHSLTRVLNSVDIKFSINE